MPHASGPRPPLVSVVVPCHVATPEQLAQLDETLETVAAQSCGDHELILVDDGSPIDVSPIATRDRRVFTVRQPHAGPAMARNAGIDVARGSAFVFLDVGDHLLEDALAHALTTLDAHRGCGFVFGARLEMHYDGTPLDARMPVPPATSRLYVPLLRGDWQIVPPSSAIFRREVVETLGGFRDPWGADDLDFYLRAAWMFQAQALPAPPLTRHRRYGAMDAPDLERRLESLRAVYERQWPLVQGDAAGEAAWQTGLRRFTEACVSQVGRASSPASPLLRRQPGAPLPGSEEAAPLGELDLDVIRDSGQQALLTDRSLQGL